jgi:hypothetical protein
MPNEEPGGGCVGDGGLTPCHRLVVVTRIVVMLPLFRR